MVCSRRCVELALAEVSARQYGELDALRREIQPPEGFVDALAVADLEDELLGWLEDRGVERAWEVAPTLAAAGVGTDWCQRVLEAVGDRGLGPALGWVSSTLSVQSLLSQVKDSTRRISELVTAVKSYSQMDRGSVQRTDVTEGLESTLVMLGHRLRERGITVERDYVHRCARGRGVPGRAEPGVDEPDRQCGRCHGRRGHAAGEHAHGRRLGGGGDRRHRSGDAPRGGPACIRGVLHDQGGRARAPAWAWTSPAASWSSAMGARSTSRASRAAR